MKNFFVIVAVIVFSALAIRADIALPEARGIQVETKVDFTDYNFYYATVPTKRTYGPNGGIEIFFEELQLKPITFSVNSRFNVPSRRFDVAAYFLAIKRSSVGENLEELKNRFISTLKEESNTNIHFFYLNNQIEDDEKDGKVDVVYVIESITENGIQTSQKFVDTISLQTQIIIIAVIGLIITVLIIALGIFFIRKKLKKS